MRPEVLEKVLRWKSLQFGFAPDAALCAPFDLELKKGTPTLILGPNGSGKTTLLRTLAGLQGPLEAAGRRSLAQGPLAERSLSENPFARSYFPSQWDLDRSLTLGDLRDLFWRSLNPSRFQNLSERLIRGLALDSRVAQLSSGERQRVFLTLMLSRDCEAYLLDEPQNFLEPAFALELIDCLQEIAASGKVVVCASHDLGWCARMALADGLLLRGREKTPLFGPLTEVLRSLDFEEVFRVRVRLWHDGEIPSGVAFSKI